jgi:hypothetical protein
MDIVSFLIHLRLLRTETDPGSRLSLAKQELAFHFLVLTPNDIYAVSFTQIHVP